MRGEATGPSIAGGLPGRQRRAPDADLVEDQQGDHEDGHAEEVGGGQNGGEDDVGDDGPDSFREATGSCRRRVLDRPKS